MTPGAFRKVALSMPEAVERAHMGHPDFRVGGRVFATLFTRESDRGMVKVPPAVQRELLKKRGGVFTRASGAWGRQGCTLIDLGAAAPATVREAIIEAWRYAAPKQVVDAYGEPSPRANSRGGPGGRATRRTRRRTGVGERRE